VPHIGEAGSRNQSHIARAYDCNSHAPLQSKRFRITFPSQRRKKVIPASSQFGRILNLAGFFAAESSHSTHPASLRDKSGNAQPSLE
jgi:hypothetical protein